MTMKRTPLSSLNDHRLALREPDKKHQAGTWARGYLLLVDADSGKVLGELNPDHLFDADGNNHERDL